MFEANRREKKSINQLRKILLLEKRKEIFRNQLRKILLLEKRKEILEKRKIYLLVEV
jgi:hypothetical protein